jgi:hypothetical protein
MKIPNQQWLAGWRTQKNELLFFYSHCLAFSSSSLPYPCFVSAISNNAIFISGD